MRAESLTIVRVINIGNGNFLQDFSQYLQRNIEKLG